MSGYSAYSGTLTLNITYCNITDALNASSCDIDFRNSNIDFTNANISGLTASRWDANGTSIYPNTAYLNVGIGTNNPTSLLHINNGNLLVVNATDPSVNVSDGGTAGQELNMNYLASGGTNTATWQWGLNNGIANRNLRAYLGGVGEIFSLTTQGNGLFSRNLTANNITSNNWINGVDSVLTNSVSSNNIICTHATGEIKKVATNGADRAKIYQTSNHGVLDLWDDATQSTRISGGSLNYITNDLVLGQTTMVDAVNNKLEVHNGRLQCEQLQLIQFNLTHRVSIQANNQVSYDTFFTTGGTKAPLCLNAYGGNVSINKLSPAEALDVNGGILATGSVGIGTASPGAKLQVVGTGQNIIRFGDSAGFQDIFSGSTYGGWNIQTGGTAIAILQSNGYVGINQTSPVHQLSVNGTALINGDTEITSGNLSVARINLTNGIQFTTNASSPSSFVYIDNFAQNINFYDHTQNGFMTITTGDRYLQIPNGTNKWRLVASGGLGDVLTAYGGGVGIGTTSVGVNETVKIFRGTASANYLTLNHNVNQEIGIIISRSSAPQNNTTWYNYLSTASETLRWYNVGDKMTLTTSGDLDIVGALSKGSGSFDIPHPLHPECERKRLIHSFIEGSRADLIYRGSKTLIDGVAIVDMDQEITSNGIGMEDGTWEVLCKNPQVSVSNNTDNWLRVRGFMIGKFLHIECEDKTASFIVDWIVIAERNDEIIKKWCRTDADGHLLLEYTRDEPCSKLIVE